MHNPKAHGRPAQLRIAQHVLLGVGVLAGDQADAVWKKRQRPLAVQVKQSLRLEFLAQSLQPLQQVAESHVAHIEHLHGQASALDPVVGFEQRDHPVALLEVVWQLRAHGGPDDERHRRIHLKVFEFAVHGAARLAPLRDFALNPCRAEAFDPALDFVGENRNGPGRVGGGR